MNHYYNYIKINTFINQIIDIDILNYQFFILLLKNSNHVKTGVLGYPDSE